MSIYHFSVQTISRSAGRSAVAAAAYRAAARIEDRTTSQVSDFTRKQHVDHHEIMLPTHAPARFSDMCELWCSVEEAEKRKDAQLCREINIALPRELSRKQQVELIRAYVKEQFVNAGMIAQLNIHDQHSQNPHAHVMLTLRDVTSDGFGKKNRDWNDKQLLEKWRQQWSVYANKALEKHGHDARIDHRTLEAQGVDRAATSHLGPAISAILARGEHSFVYDRMLEQQAAVQAIIDERLEAQKALDEANDSYDQAMRVLEDAREAARNAVNLASADPPPPPPAGGGFSARGRARARTATAQATESASTDSRAATAKPTPARARKRVQAGEIEADFVQAREKYEKKKERLDALKEQRDTLKTRIDAVAMLAKQKPWRAFIDAHVITLSDFKAARDDAAQATQQITVVEQKIEDLKHVVADLAKPLSMLLTQYNEALAAEAQQAREQREAEQRAREQMRNTYTRAEKNHEIER